MIEIKVNISKRRFGARVSPDLSPTNCQELGDILNMRTVTSLVASLYDPLGLLSPITVKAKLLLRDTHLIPKLT